MLPSQDCPSPWAIIVTFRVLQNQTHLEQSGNSWNYMKLMKLYEIIWIWCISIFLKNCFSISKTSRGRAKSGHHEDFTQSPSHVTGRWSLWGCGLMDSPPPQVNWQTLQSVQSPQTSVQVLQVLQASEWRSVCHHSVESSWIMLNQLKLPRFRSMWSNFGFHPMLSYDKLGAQSTSSSETEKMSKFTFCAEPTEPRAANEWKDSTRPHKLPDSKM